MPGSREEDIWRNYAFSLYDLYDHALAQEPLPRGHEIYNFGKPFFGHHYYILGLSDLCLGVEKKIFKEIQQFYTFYPQITSPLGEGSWNLQFLVSLPYRCYTPNLVKIGPVVLEKKMLTHDKRRRTPTHSSRSHEWLRWPKKPKWLRNAAWPLNTIAINVLYTDTHENNENFSHPPLVLWLFPIWCIFILWSMWSQLLPMWS